MLYQYDDSDAFSFKRSISSYADLSEPMREIGAHQSRCKSLIDEAERIISLAEQTVSTLEKRISEAESQKDLEEKRREREAKTLRQEEERIRQLEAYRYELLQQLAEAQRNFNARKDYAPPAEREMLANLVQRIDDQLSKQKQTLSVHYNERLAILWRLEELEKKIDRLNKEIEADTDKKDRAYDAMEKAEGVRSKCDTAMERFNEALSQLEDMEKDLERDLQEVEENVGKAMDGAEAFYYTDLSGRGGGFGMGSVRFRVDDEEIEEYRQLLERYKTFLEEREELLRRIFESYSWRDNIYRMTSENVEENKIEVGTVADEMQYAIQGIDRMLTALAEYTRWG